MSGSVGVAGALLLMAGTASAAPGNGHGAKVYVSPSGGSGGKGTSCSNAAFNSVQDAVEAAPAHGTVLVCPGTYAESVTVDKPLTLEGRKGAVIDASGQAYGVGVTADYSTITGLTVENANSTAAGAPDDGIITAGFGADGPVAADHVTISDDTVENNVGSGIDLNSTSYSTAVGDHSYNNGVGINMSDDLGLPASHNVIADNVSDGNPGGCGIVLADHTGMGIFDNLVIGNTADDNGLGTSTATDGTSGSGIILASAAGGGVYNNTVTLNSMSGNGHAGIALHAHIPGLNFSGNVLSFNRIGTNNVLGDEGDSQTTGIYLGDADPLTITTIGNQISDDYYGIFTAGQVTVRGEWTNVFRHDHNAVGGIATF